MKQLIQQALDELSGPLQNIEIKKFEAVHGGCIHKSWKLHAQDGSLLFAKTCEKKKDQCKTCDDKAERELNKEKFTCDCKKGFKEDKDKKCIKNKNPHFLF